jgi:transmembrane sensor
MKYDDERPLAEDIHPRVDAARLARQWSAVSTGLVVRPRRTLFLAAILPAALVAVVLAIVLVARPWRAQSPVVAASTPDSLQLPDGSKATLSRGAEVVVEAATRQRVHLILGAGSIDLDVTHVEGRPFVVTAAGHDVTVLGTAFSVRLEPSDGHRTLSVVVTRGRVAVTGPTGQHMLDAGQSWSSRVDGILGDGRSATEAAASSEASAVSPPVAPSSTLAASPASSIAELDGVEPPAIDPSARAAVPAPVEGPRELLARATEARTSGRPRDAAVALDTLRKRHRSDARAGLAAFELGRVRMDALNDPSGAAEAFADAIVLAPSAPFREDAEARRVEALDALPDRARCERVRDAYLSRYPAGLHARQVAQRCKRP